MHGVSGPTVILYRNNHGHTFGGYYSGGWCGCDPVQTTASYAFVFSLTNGEKFEMVSN